MRKSKLVRLELILLAAVTLLLAYRVIEGPPEPEGLVVFSDVEPEELHRQALATDHPVRVSIDAAGSFETGDVDGDGQLAAYGWMLRREDRKVVWKMTPELVHRERETLALAQDTVELAPGTYDVFYTSYGNQYGRHFGVSFLDRLLGEEGAWRGDADRWQMIVRPANGDYLTQLESESDDVLSPTGSGLLWSTAPMKGHEAAEYVFQVSDPVELRLYAIGEIDDHQMDYGWIENAVSGERVWEMTRANTEPAGGWDVNRLFDGTVPLPPGIYRAAFETDARQNWDDWVGNPPFDAAGWGFTLFAGAGAPISPYDPWEDRAPIIQIDRVGDDERRSVQFRVTSPVQVAAYGLGELGDNGRYDYAWIRNNETQQTVWEMTPERSRPAGGHNNRRELAFLTLQPSTYTVTYETDDSHSYDSWRHGRPDNPERWGVTLFPVGGALDSSAVEVLDSRRENLSDDRPRREPEPPPGRHMDHRPRLSGELLVDLTGLGNEKRVSKSFTLDRDQMLHVRALGEISISAPYDYGWIENAETGEIVWEMSWQNTMPAGGEDRNRMFEAPVSLPAGEYVVHFKTDFSHAYGDFSNEETPRFPEAWGIQIVRPEPPPQ